MKSRNKSPNKNQKVLSPERICGRTYVSALAAASSGLIPLQPSPFPRALAVADVFEFYRFTSVKVILHPQGAEYAVGYSNQTFDTAPTTLAGVLELPVAARQVQNSSVFKELNLGRQELLSNGPLKWYKTVVGTPDALFETQGNLYIAAGSSQTLNLVIEWEVEFSQWNLAAQSPKPHMDFVPIAGTDLFRRVPRPTQASPLSVKADRESTEALAS